MRVAVRMRSRLGLYDSDTRAGEILGAPHERAATREGDLARISFQVPVRVVGLRVDGSSPARGVRARTPLGDWFELTCEPVATLGGVRHPRVTLLASGLEVAAAGALVEIHVDYEVHALHDFAEANGLDFRALAYGRESFDQFHGYRILGACPEEPRQIKAVAISRPAGRFGNHLMQLVHATHVARELGVDTIYVPRMPWFGASADGSGSDAKGLRYVGYADFDDMNGPALFGTFLFEDLEPAVKVLDGDLRQRLVDRHVSSLFTPPPLRGPRPSNHVAVHLRSGDLFDRPDPHPNFVQPPLAFYTTAVSHFAATHPGVRVTLVYEDEANPVIAALRTFLESAGIPYSVSTSTLAADLAALLEHRALVLGRGSFGVAVAALSANVETLYFPWSEAKFPGLVRERGLESYLIEEIEQRYLEAGEWTNSAEQRRLMVEYPESNLRAARLR